MHSFCIHAHFYQPPREDPITGIIPQEGGATPFPNWNEKIHAECYRPNAQLGNFEHISFNIGPTLFEWMLKHDPFTCRRILAQDSANVNRYGVGNAIAQPFHHTILPLASESDRRTQIIWGISQFEHRFGRKPQGMWLPEAAVDINTLLELSRQGIEFTILAPWQAAEEHLDVSEPYIVDLPEGKQIVVFFYHGGLSGGISFNPAMTVNADQFVRQDLMKGFRAEKRLKQEEQLITIASDGELYGHHQPLRDYFLAHLVNGASLQAGLTPKFPALWLKDHPPRKRVRIREQTSWSCHHGVGRWARNCGCIAGDQSWKTHFRAAFDQLSIRLDGLYAGALSQLSIDPWELRNRYIRVLLEQQPLEDLVAEMAGKRLPLETQTTIRTHLDAQLERQRMYASCGWFFEDFDRIEPRNSVAYAAQAVRLARKATGIDLAPQLLTDLRLVTSTRSGLRGDQVFSHHLERAGSLD